MIISHTENGVDKTGIITATNGMGFKETDIAGCLFTDDRFLSNEE
jgi:hypothetical protein